MNDFTDNTSLAQEFCNDVENLAKKYGLPFFLATEGAVRSHHEGEETFSVLDKAYVTYEQAHSTNESADPVDDMTLEDFLGNGSAKAKIVNEATMEDSYIFQKFNDNHELTTKMISYIKGASVITEDFIQEQLLQIKKSRISPIVDKVLDAYRDGTIEILYNRSVKIPVSCPYIIRKDPTFRGNVQGVKASIFIANYSAISKQSGALTIPMKNLYVLLESAYISVFIHLHPSLVQRNYGLMKVMCSVYTSMFTRILSRDYAITLDQNINDGTNFIISKFFLEKLWELKNPDVVFNTAMINITNPNPAELRLVSDAYDDANIESVADMLAQIRTLSPRMEDLSVQMVIQRYMTTFNGGAVIAIDYLPYLFYVVINTVLGGYLLSQTALSDIIRNNKLVKQFYPEIAKLIG